MSAPAIYVEVRIHSDLEDLWRHTQEPELHQRWDLRFTRIEYLDRTDTNGPQEFLYSTNIGFGVTVSGVGTTVGERHRADGTATSALRFWSDDPVALIRKGSGYWRYRSTDDGIRFLTRYDYEPRWGAPGRWVESGAFGKELLANAPRGKIVTSIYQRALGDDFNRLHPAIQRRFGFSSEDGIAQVGTGVMEELWRGPFFTLPFLYVGTWRNIMFPDRGRNIPFTVKNYAYLDSFGRETVTWVREFVVGHKMRRFDATMIYSDERQRIVDYLGNHQHLAVDLHLSVADNGGIAIRSGEQRFYERRLGFRFPLFFSGIAEVCEWYEPSEQRFRIDVAVRNPFWGKLFSYRGWFTVEDIPVAGRDDVPSEVRPRREERRE